MLADDEQSLLENLDGRFRWWNVKSDPKVRRFVQTTYLHHEDCLEFRFNRISSSTCVDAKDFCRTAVHRPFAGVAMTSPRTSTSDGFGKITLIWVHH